MSRDTGTQQLGKYELRELLGHGRMTELWKAYDTQLQRPVAIRILHVDLQDDPDFLARFENQARIIASLYHPNIVQVHDFQVLRYEPADPQGSSPASLSSAVAGSPSQVLSFPRSERADIYIVMDYIEGQTLAEYMNSTSRKRRFPAAADIVHLFTAISQAVDYAHQQGMMHLDIHPENILLYKKVSSNSQALNDVGEPIFINSGISRLLNTNISMLSGSLLKTTTYTSPEQAGGSSGNESSDIYALGVILYEICTGTLPFRSDSPSGLLKQHINTPPPLPSSLNSMIEPALDEVILRSLAKNPAERFPNATSMAIALTEAFNLPIPESLTRPAYATATLQGATRFDPAIPGASSVMTYPGATLVQSPLTPVTPTNVMSSGSDPGVYSSQNTPLIASLHTPATLPSSQKADKSAMATINRALQDLSVIVPPVQPRRRRRGLLVALIALLVLVLAGSALGAFYYLSPKSGTVSSIVGYAFFVSSGQLSNSNSQGINDELRIVLHNVAAPPAGKSYYAWLLGDIVTSKHADTSCQIPGNSQIYLGRLPFNHGTVEYLYPGDTRHTNLISCTSRLLITAENTSSTPLAPSSDPHARLFYAEIPQQPQSFAKDPNGFSALDNLRQLLYEGGDLKSKGLHGGVDIQILRNAEKVWEWASSARDTWDGQNTGTIGTQFIHRQVIRILDYIDGRSFIEKDVPFDTPALVDKTSFQISLLQISPKGSSSYMQRITSALDRIIAAPGATPDMQMHARQALAELASVQKWLQQVRKDAKLLFKMSNEQLMQTATGAILDDMQSQAGLAFVGQINSATGNVQGGVVQEHYEIQQLATFSIVPYPA